VPPRLVAFKRTQVVREPLGVVAVVSPWNFPFGVPFTQVVAAVAMGNAAVLKPSELTPLTGSLVGEVFEHAGFPAGLVRVVHGAGDTGRALVTAGGIAKVMFTGSAATGRSVASSLAPLLRPVTLELGGKDPMLVFADCDRKRALGGALWGSFTNCGQVCAGAERIYVERRIYDEFAVELTEATAALQIGDGRDPATDSGPLITEEQRDRVESLVSDALGNGGRIAAGGGGPTPAARLVPRATCCRRAHRGRIGEEELFGPVVTLEPLRWRRMPSGWPTIGVRAGARACGRGARHGTPGSGQARRGSVDERHRVLVLRRQGTLGWHEGLGYGRTHGLDGLRELSRTGTSTSTQPAAGAVVVPLPLRGSRRAERRARAPLPPQRRLPRARRGQAS
jgi:succinate-semialdehyde dehydrogenase/glutarate-semialdehyde dehydrogenase